MSSKLWPFQSPMDILGRMISSLQGGSMNLHNNLTAGSYDEDEAMAKAIAESQGFSYDSEEYQIQLTIAESKRLAEQEAGKPGRKK